MRLSRRYLPDRFLPDKAIDLMDEAAAQVSQQVSSRPDPTYQKIDEALHELREQKQAAILRQDFEQAAILRDRQNQTVEQLRPAHRPAAEESAAGCAARSPRGTSPRWSARAPASRSRR